jgi:hypothetical protein
MSRSAATGRPMGVVWRDATDDAQRGYAIEGLLGEAWREQRRSLLDIGPWLPEPVIDPPASVPDPAERSRSTTASAWHSWSCSL